jgi:hypothetical protein
MGSEVSCDAGATRIPVGPPFVGLPGLSALMALNGKLLTEPPTVIVHPICGFSSHEFAHSESIHPLSEYRRRFHVVRDERVWQGAGDLVGRLPASAVARHQVARVDLLQGGDRGRDDRLQWKSLAGGESGAIMELPIRRRTSAKRKEHFKWTPNTRHLS